MKANAMAGILVLAGGAACGDRPPSNIEIRPLEGSPTVRVSSIEAPVPLDTLTASTLSSTFRAAASVALPAVVRVNVTRSIEAGSRGAPFEPDPEAQDRRARGTGSGFIVDPTGHILTNHHVVAEAERVSVVLTDGRDYPAEVVGADPNTDIAVIRITSDADEPFPAAQLGDSDQLTVGDWVLALGNPLDLEFTVTAGIVSAKGRALNILRNDDGTQLEAFIQTDAAINPGNSGGPLVDLLGRVVGINSAIQSETGFFAGAGFAIPINLARKVANDLIRDGVVHRPRLGVVIQDVTAADAAVYGLPRITGAEIASVTPGQPAARAGLEMGDVVIAVNGEPIASVTELQARIARFQPDETVRLSLIRYGQTLEREVELGEFAAAQNESVRQAPRATGSALLGFHVQPAPRAMAEAVNLDPRTTVAIDSVDRFGPAIEAGILPNRILLQINGQEIHSITDLERIGRELRTGQIVSAVLIAPQQPDAAPTIYNYRVR
ncbi:MAG: trypsin-like peptidase domain-containing protein [Longimicrobiales bacterium]